MNQWKKDGWLKPFLFKHGVGYFAREAVFVFLHSRETAQYAPQRMEFDRNTKWLVQGDPSSSSPSGQGKGKGKKPSH